MTDARAIIRDLLAEHHCSAAERAYKEHEEGADRIIDALASAGLVLVPRDPTEAMVRNSVERAEVGIMTSLEVWAAMLTAAPTDGRQTP